MHQWVDAISERLGGHSLCLARFGWRLATITSARCQSGSTGGSRAWRRAALGCPAFNGAFLDGRYAVVHETSVRKHLLSGGARRAGLRQLVSNPDLDKNVTAADFKQRQNAFVRAGQFLGGHSPADHTR